ncbi:MAG: hypothetical protein ACRDWX_02035 [Acidimicrobiia bacterium]
MIQVANGQRVPVTGWFVDRHGHRLFLQRGRLVPVCPRVGHVTTAWRLVSRA